jgi:hypothetical protein
MSQDQSGGRWKDSAAIAAACDAAGATAAGIGIMQDKAVRAGALASCHKPAFWWAIDQVPWTRIGAELRAEEERKKRLAEAHDQCASATAAAFALLGAR